MYADLIRELRETGMYLRSVGQKKAANEMFREIVNISRDFRTRSPLDRRVIGFQEDSEVVAIGEPGDFQEYEYVEEDEEEEPEL